MREAHSNRPDACTARPTRMMDREALGMREGGFGILMSRGLVDKMSYNDKGNEVRLIKYFKDVPLRGEDGRVISTSK